MIKVGQKLRYVGQDHPWVTNGKIYTVKGTILGRPNVTADDGTSYVIEIPSNWQIVDSGSIYLAHPISNTYEAEASIKTAQLLRDKGFTVYAAAENASINDKLNNPTPRDIFKADCDKIKECDTFIVNITGGMQDGTLFEVGYAAALGKRIIAYSTNTRLANPQHWNGIPSASANHLVLGAIDTWCNSLEEVLHELQS